MLEKEWKTIGRIDIVCGISEDEREKGNNSIQEIPMAGHIEFQGTKAPFWLAYFCRCKKIKFIPLIKSFENHMKNHDPCIYTYTYTLYLSTCKIKSSYFLFFSPFDRFAFCISSLKVVKYGEKEWNKIARNFMDSNLTHRHFDSEAILYICAYLKVVDGLE